MGLLGESFDDPRTFGLLALAGNMIKGDLGGALSGYGTAYADAKQGLLKQQLGQAQIANLQSEVEARKAQIAKQQELLALGKRIAASSGQPAYQQGQLGSGTAGILPTAPGVDPMAQVTAPRGVAGADINDLAQFHMLGGPDLLPYYKAANEGFERKPNTFYDIPGRGRQYVGDPTKGFTYDNGRVGLMPGFTDATSAITLATEAPKTLLNSAGKINLRPNANGTQSPVSELAENPTLQNILAPLFGGQGAPAAAPGVAPAARPVVSPTDQRGADAESIRMIQAELQNPNIPADQRAGMERELARLTQAQTQPGFPKPSMIRNPGRIEYGKTTAQETQEAAAREAALGNARLPAQTTDKVNETWLKTSYEPTVTAGTAANDMLTNVRVARQSMRNMGGTGWGTDAKVLGASILAGIGIAPENAKLYAANGQTFQNAAMTNLQTVLNAAKGPQTEGDADRASKTFAQLRNTPQANEFVLDILEAKAQRDAMKAAFFQQALPIARQKGDLQEVEREWMKRAPSVFSMPSMKRWAEGVK